MTQAQIKQIEDSFRNGDCLVFQIGEKVYVSDQVYKHRKEATIEMKCCNEIDITCFEPNGDYWGDVLPGQYNIILQDHLADFDNSIESRYYDDEVVSIHKLHEK